MAGEYRISFVLGKGGMGTVYAGVQPVIGKKVAIKVLHAALSEEPEVMKRFVAEARAVNTIGHPNIVDIFAFGTFPNGAQYCVMEFLSGRSLQRHLEEHGTLGCADAIAIFPQVLDALEAAHRRGIVHRDLKPDNIYLADHPDGGYIVKLLDFGIAKFTEESLVEGRTRTGVIMGTPVYMSPEQCVGEGIDLRTDVYALGVILYKLFTGELPVNGQSYGELIQKHLHELPRSPGELVDMPKDLEKAILWCLEKDKEDRPSGIAELRQALMPVLTSAAQTEPPTLVRKTKPDPRIQRKRDAAARRRSRAQGRGKRLTAALAVLMVVLSVAAVLLWKRLAPTAAITADTVTLQFVVQPQGVDYELWVDGERVSGTPPMVEVARSETTPVQIKAVVEGYEPYQAEHMPVLDGTVPVVLERIRLAAPTSAAAGPGANEAAARSADPAQPGASGSPPIRSSPRSTAEDDQPASSSRLKPYGPDDVFGPDDP